MNINLKALPVTLTVCNVNNPWIIFLLCVYCSYGTKLKICPTGRKCRILLCSTLDWWCEPVLDFKWWKLHKKLMGCQVFESNASCLTFSMPRFNSTCKSWSFYTGHRQEMKNVMGSLTKMNNCVYLLHTFIAAFKFRFFRNWSSIFYWIFRLSQVFLHLYSVEKARVHPFTGNFQCQRYWIHRHSYWTRCVKYECHHYWYQFAPLGKVPNFIVLHIRLLVWTCSGL